MFRGVEVNEESLAKAEALLEELRPESPLRHRLSTELDELANCPPRITSVKSSPQAVCGARVVYSQKVALVVQPILVFFRGKFCPRADDGVCRSTVLRNAMTWICRMQARRAGAISSA